MTGWERKHEDVLPGRVQRGKGYKLSGRGKEGGIFKLWRHIRFCRLILAS